VNLFGWFRGRWGFDADGEGEAEQAREDAQTALHDVRRQSEEARHIAQALRDLKERNHFGESIEAAMARRKRL
jgi:F0F1-type ATP synthase membrane subunit b/b'